MYKITAISDTHGRLLDIEPTDLLIIAGDFCPRDSHAIHFQHRWLAKEFRQWLLSVPAKQIVAIAGNHDFIFDGYSELLPLLPWKYLQDSGFTWNKYKVWGTPWQTKLPGWGFYLPPEKVQRQRSLIPWDTEILITHEPPYGYGDRVISGEHIGCPVLLDRIKELTQLKYVICGHVHEHRGSFKYKNIDIFNVATLDEQYKYARPPVEFHLPCKNASNQVIQTA